MEWRGENISIKLQPVKFTFLYVWRSSKAHASHERCWYVNSGLHVPFFSALLMLSDSSLLQQWWQLVRQLTTLPVFTMWVTIKVSHKCKSLKKLLIEKKKKLVIRVCDSISLKKWTVIWQREKAALQTNIRGSWEFVANDCWVTSFCQKTLFS